MYTSITASIRTQFDLHYKIPICTAQILFTRIALERLVRYHFTVQHIVIIKINEP
jgi:hypothetical protein